MIFLPLLCSRVLIVLERLWVRMPRRLLRSAHSCRPRAVQTAEESSPVAALRGSAGNTELSAEGTEDIWKPLTCPFLSVSNIFLSLCDQKPSGGPATETAGFPDAHVPVSPCGHRAGLWLTERGRSDIHHSPASHSKPSLLPLLSRQQSRKGSTDDRRSEVQHRRNLGPCITTWRKAAHEPRTSVYIMDKK